MKYNDDVERNSRSTHTTQDKRGEEWQEQQVRDLVDMVTKASLVMSYHIGCHVKPSVETQRVSLTLGK
jgi:hypothetical protein